jgi:NDP-sugar pyrophosphorylase family protein
MFDHHVFTAVNSHQAVAGAANWRSPTPFSGWWKTATPCILTSIAGGGSTPASRATCSRPTIRVLEEIEHNIEGYVDRDSKVDHLVTIQRGAEIINSVGARPGDHRRVCAHRQQLHRPVHQHLPPHTGRDSEIEHSIVLDHSRIVGIPSRIQDSIIGRDVEVTYSPIKPKAYKMTLGDHSRVGLL